MTFVVGWQCRVAPVPQIDQISSPQCHVRLDSNPFKANEKDRESSCIGFVLQSRTNASTFAV
eukprot:2651482-Amphidinium_carterae.1